MKDYDIDRKVNYLFSTFVLGNSLGGLRNSVLSEFSGEDKTDSSLDFFGGDGGTLVVSSELGSFTSNTFEDIIDERVHDTHSLLGDVNIRVALTEDLENVARVRFVAALTTDTSGLSGLLGGSFSGGFTSGLLFSFGGHYKFNKELLLRPGGSSRYLYDAPCRN